MEIRRVRFNDQTNISERHPELFAQYPALTTPILASPSYENSDFPFLFYAIEDGLVASHFASFPDTLFGAEGAYGWVWNGNLFTDPAFRGRGLARMIVDEQLLEFSQRKLIWGGVFSSPAALRLYQRMEFLLPGHAPRLCMIRNIRPFLRHHTSNSILNRFGGVAADLTFSAIEKFWLSGSRRKCVIEEITAERFFVLLASGREFGEERFYWGKDLQWFETRRNKRGIDRIYSIRPNAESEATMFMLVRLRINESRPIREKYKGVNIMSVMEFGNFSFRADFAETLIDAIIELFVNSDADMVEFVTSSTPVYRSARKYGFFPLGAGMSFKLKLPKNLQFEAREIRLPDWHLTHYCGDAFGFE